MDDRARNRVVLFGGFGVLASAAAAFIGWQYYQGNLPAPPPAEPAATAKAPKKKALGSIAAPGDGLHMPSSKRCLAPPSDVEGEQGMAASEGLDYDSVSSSMRSFVPNTLRCVPEGGIDGTVNLTITAGCDGRVASVSVNDPGSVPPEVVDCVKDTLRFAEFPAHDMPDGYEFDYPLTFSR